MDIEAALKRLRAAQHDFAHAQNDDQALDAATELSEAASNIDEWLGKGGALPAAWARR